MFDPPFDISHLSQEEQNRIRRGELFPSEMSKLRNGKSPWPKPSAPQERDSKSPEFKAADEWYSNDPDDESFITGRRRKFTALRIPSKNKKPQRKPDVDDTKTPSVEQNDLPLSTGTKVVGSTADDKSVPSPALTEPQLRARRIQDAHNRGELPDPEDLAEEEADELRYQQRLAAARERKRKEVEAEFKTQPNRETKPGDPGARKKPPLSKWSLWVQRGLLAVVTGTAWWLFDKFDAPVWLGVSTIILCLISMALLRRLEKTERRKRIFIGFLVVYALAAMIIVTISKPSTEKPQQPVSTLHSSPSITPTPSPSFQVYPPFHEAHIANEKKLRTAKGDAILLQDSYVAQHQFEKALYVGLPVERWFFLNLHYKWSSNPDPHPDYDLRFFNDDCNRTRFSTPKDSSPPQGGLALLWTEDMRAWEKRMGWRKWQCYYTGAGVVPHYQEFDGGYVIGPFSHGPTNKRGTQIFVLTNDNEWALKVTPEVEAPSCIKALDIPEAIGPCPKILPPLR